MATAEFVRLGNRIRELRAGKGWTLNDLSEQLKRNGLKQGHSIQHLSGIERGNGTVGTALIEALDSVLDARGELVRLLRDAKVPLTKYPISATIELDAHLFYPVNVQAEGELSAARRIPMAAYDEPIDAHLVDTQDGLRAIYRFPFGCVVAHECHRLSIANLTQASIWRSDQINLATTRAIDHLDKYTSLKCRLLDAAPYCLTYFHLRQGLWSEELYLDNALRILANPSQLQRRHRRASPDIALGLEHALLTSAWATDDLVGFHCHGNHRAFASWAAVASRDLHDESGIDQAIVQFEIQLQALWCYSYGVARSGQPFSDLYGEAFLSRTLRRLTQPLPTEHTSDRVLREAITETSRIRQTVNNAIEAIKEARQ